jgi:hypothetical protein
MRQILRVVLGCLAAASLAGATPPMLSAFMHHSRVVVMFAPAADDPRFAAQSTQLATLGKQPTFQSLIVAGVAGDTVAGLSDTAAALRRRFAVAPNAFGVVLIGKDGHVALRRDAVTSAKTLASTIDAMPMRQEELKRGEAN